MNSVSACVATTFSPTLFGAEILALQASLVTNYSAVALDAYRYVAPSVELKNATFCNVTVTYTHPGQGGKINVETWLPLPDDWNGRLQAVGGGGWVAGRFFLSYGAMNGALADGFATISTDAGVAVDGSSSSWALTSPGNVNLYKLQNLGSVSLEDEAIIGKSLIQSFYGRPAEYSYWTGCSQGGRQGLMLAQRYPGAFDGIIAGAPAINFPQLAVSIQWPQQIMNEMGVFPHGCEIDAITAAAVKDCDGLDGVIDGVVSRVGECLRTFDPFSIVGRAVNCSSMPGAYSGNTKIRIITEAAAMVVNATWHGVTTGNRAAFFWPGLEPGADLTGNSPTSFGSSGVIATNCTMTGEGQEEICVGTPSYLGQEWLKLFVGRGDSKLDLSNLARTEFDRLAHQSVQRYQSFIETADPDLTSFQDAGGKMITFHGLADNIIPPRSTEMYYNAVSALIPNVQDFYRYFEAPGLGHCFGGASGQPTSLFSQLQAWVENGTAPDQTPIQLRDQNSKFRDRILCPYPRRAQLDQEGASPGGFACVESRRPCV